MYFSKYFPKALQLFDFLHWFEGIIVSGTEKIRKPFPEIYQITLDRFNIAPSETLFIDDNLRNIRGAEALGINGIHFLTPEKLIKDLNNFKIKLPDPKDPVSLALNIIEVDLRSSLISLPTPFLEITGRITASVVGAVLLVILISA